MAAQRLFEYTALLHVASHQIHYLKRCVGFHQMGGTEGSRLGGGCDPRERLAVAMAKRPVASLAALGDTHRIGGALGGVYARAGAAYGAKATQM
jgi:hypothetical protein